MASADAGDGTFVREARRRQLVECAIEVIAEVGLGDATLTRVAKRAGIARGGINYHFRDRGELLDQVVAQVYRLGAEQVGPAVEAGATPRERLRAFVVASVRFYAAYPRHLTALDEIHRAAHRAQAGRPMWTSHSTELDDVRAILTAGQQAGQFRDFDPGVVAATVRAVLDGALTLLTTGADPERLAVELWTFVNNATEISA